MRGRSWMAALTLAAGLTPAFSLAGDSPSPAPAGSPAQAAATKSETVSLQLRIAGLGPKGCEVEIKPGHPGCKFKALKETVGESGILNLVLKDVQTVSADRDCTFAITIHEPGQADRTMFRGLRITATPEKNKLPSLVCYLSSPSRLAKASETEAASKR